MARRPGLILYARGFEANLAGRGLSKTAVAKNAGMSPGFLADLLARRGGVTRERADQLAAAVGVEADQLFPELDGWPAPPINREAKRGKS